MQGKGCAKNHMSELQLVPEHILQGLQKLLQGTAQPKPFYNIEKLP